MTSHLCSDSPLPSSPSDRLIVLEGMPGAGKTTAINMLASLGHTVVGEYTDNTGHTLDHSGHPDIGDDDAHQLNWLRKAAQCATRLERYSVVYADRDWLSSLAYAHGIAADDGGTMLAHRTSWAMRHLREGALVLPSIYVVFDLDPASSIARRAGHLRPRHPWGRPEVLERLRAFYRDPAESLQDVSAELSEALAVPLRINLSGHDHPIGIFAHLDCLNRPSASRLAQEPS